jgi:hypothetical protein
VSHRHDLDLILRDLSIHRNIVEEEQRGATRAGYGEELVINLSRDLQARFGRGFGRANLFQMKAFFLAYRDTVQTVVSLRQTCVKSTVARS